MKLKNDYSEGNIIPPVDGSNTDHEMTGEVPRSVRKQINWKKLKNPMVPIPKENNTPGRGSEVMKSVDYLKEMRAKRSTEDSNPYR